MSAYGDLVSGTKRPDNRYELLTCAWSGHALVGENAAVVTPEDSIVVREVDALRWCRCLRCDAWLPVAIPEDPSHQRVPAREEIEVPLRGPALRDRYVLRLIAIDRVVHVVGLLQSGRLHWQGDSDAAITKGLLALLIEGLEGLTPAEVVAIDPAFIAGTGLQGSLTPSRANGFLNIFKMMQAQARSLLVLESPATSAEAEA